MAAALMLTKVFATMFTIGGGGNGGMFGSSLFAGSFLGLLFVEGLRIMGIAELDHVQFIVVAMAGLLSGVIHAPLTAIFLIAEITGGYTLFVPLMIVSALSYFVTKYFEPYSVYTRKLAISGELVLNNPDFEVLNHLKLKDLVEKDFSPVPLNGTLRDLIKVIPESKRNLFPVVDHFNQFHGVILLDDIRALMFKPEKYDTLMIRDLMQRAPAELEIKEPMSAVMKKFEDTQAWNLPVLVGMKYEGFVSKSAIFSNYRNQLIEDLVKE
jgi:CIC family chloride channel protein